MIANYLKISVRNLGKRKSHTFLNIAGLTIGMTCCLLIFHYVAFERSYDTFHANNENILRVRLDSYKKGTLAWKSATSFPAIGPTMKKDFPEVKDFCRLIDAELLLTNESTQVKFNETKGYFADPSVLNMFNIQFKQGNPANALTAPDKMIISENMAQRYFAKENPIGKKLFTGNPQEKRVLEIAGVFKDYPSNSHLDIQYLVSYETFKKEILMQGDSSNPAETAWGWYDFYTYIEVKPGTDIAKLEAKLPAFSNRYMNSSEYAKKANNRNELYLIPLKDIHLYSNFNQEAEVNGNGQAIGFLFLVAIFIIGIAWINYINLATARSVERAREVGVRKVLGAIRTDLITQFLTESFLLNLVSLVLSLLFFLLLIQPFDSFTGHPVTHLFLTPYYWGLFFALFAGGTLLSGIYPAFVLSGFQPIVVLKGVFKNAAGGLALRKGLIIVQFTTSVVLIAGTIIVYKQVSFMRNQQLGANISQTLVLKGVGSVDREHYKDAFQPFKTEVLQLNGIKKMAASSNVMGQEIYWTNSHRRIDKQESTPVTLYNLAVDYDFLPLFDMKLAAGRNFSEDFGTDKKSVLLNETAVKLLEFNNPADAIGKRIRSGGDTNTIAGVLADYHQEGLQKVIQPMIVRLRPTVNGCYSIKIEDAQLAPAIAAIGKSWKKYFPNDPFSYSFLDETFTQQYKADMLFGKVFGIFAFLAILIACFGLLGLSAYNVLQRTKEIGIRKVLGASAQSILVLLSKDYLKLIVVALLLAVPLGWYLMHEWLQDFAYRTTIQWWIFAVAGVLALLIALITIVLQATRAVTDSPVKSLRSE